MRTTRPRAALTAYTVVGAVTVPLALLVLPAHLATEVATTLLGVVGAALVALTLLRERPPAAGAWAGVAATMLLTAAAATLAALQEAGHLPAGRPSFADAAALSGFVVLAHAHLAFLPDRGRVHRRAGLLDAMLLAVALGMLGWTFAGRSSVELHGTPPAELAMTFVYGLGALVLLSSCVQLWNRTRRAHVSARMLVLAIVVLAATNLAHAATLLAGGASAPGVVTTVYLGWTAFCFLLGVAALHPATREPATTVRAPTTAAWQRLATLIVLTGFMPVLVVIGDRAQDRPTSWTLLVCAEAAMLAVLLLRVADVHDDLHGALRRELALRRANDRLVAAVDVVEVRRVLVETAEELLTTNLDRAWLVEDPQLAGFRPDPAEPGDVHVLRERTDLHDTIDAADDDVLVVTVLPTRSSQQVALVVATAEPPTTSATSALDALAQCAGLALDRINLGDIVLEQQSEERLQRLLQDASDVVAVLDPQLDIRYVTPAVERVLGRTVDDVVGASWLAYVQREDRDAARELIERSSHGWPARGELRMTTRDGSTRYVDVAVSRIADADGGGFTIACHDITTRHELEEQLTHQAFHDPLTGLANRALFQNRLRHTVDRTRRTGRPFAVLFIDLDDFKTVNDSLGHAAGDALLRTVGSRISANLRANDTAARLGGDEFAVILEDLGAPEEAADVADRLVDALAAPVSVSGAEIIVGASIGIAHGGTGDDDPDALMRNADLALFDAKSGGKSRSAVFAQVMHDTAMDRLRLSAEMRRAIDHDEFVVALQPIFFMDPHGDGTTDTVVGVEALLRWDHPERGLMPPSQFVSLAEETGMVVPIGRVVLRRALEAVSRLQTVPGHEDLTVAVNLSGRQLHDPGVVDSVRDALRDTGVRPSALVLEITESVLLPDGGVTVDRLLELTRLGVRLYIDDFGTGYSSLAYLRDLPVAGIKLAREFVRPLPGTDTESGLVRAIHTLAETLGLDQVVAEGIETAEQRRALLELGYRVGQGYHLARPTDEAGLVALLTRRPVASLR